MGNKLLFATGDVAKLMSNCMNKYMIFYVLQEGTANMLSRARREDILIGRKAHKRTCYRVIANRKPSLNYGEFDYKENSVVCISSLAYFEYLEMLVVWCTYHKLCVGYAQVLLLS